MLGSLKKTFWMVLAPAGALLLLAGLARSAGIGPPAALTLPAFVPPLLFVLSAVFAIALPVFWRTLFAHRMQHQQVVSEPVWIQFERRLIVIALVSAYLLIPAMWWAFDDFYFLGMALMALYAGYYFYPSRRRIQFDRRLFRVRQA